MARSPVIITRAQPGANATAKRVIEMGLQALVSPALTLHLVEPIPELPTRGAAGIAFTSANGVRFFTDVSEMRDLKAWCVGPSTLEVAKVAGFSDALNADGNSEDLARLIIRDAAPNAGAILHIANTAAGDILQTKLEAADFDVRFVGLYEPRGADDLSILASTALAGGEPVAVLIHSAKGAASFKKIVSDYDLSNVTFVAVSEKAAEPVSNLGQVLIAARPNEASLLSALIEWQLAL